MSEYAVREESGRVIEVVRGFTDTVVVYPGNRFNKNTGVMGCRLKPGDMIRLWFKKAYRYYLVGLIGKACSDCPFRPTNLTDPQSPENTDKCQAYYIQTSSI